MWKGGHNMKFQRKIIVIYLCFFIFTICVFSWNYSKLLLKQEEERELQNLDTMASLMIRKAEDMYEDLESIIVYLLSDIQVIEALDDLSKKEDVSYEKLYFDPSYQLIRSKMINYYFLEQYYKIIIFNSNNVLISNTDVEKNYIQDESVYLTYPWVEKVTDKKGKDILIGLHDDNWEDNDMKVISLVKEIQGNQRGIIEVQISEEMLKNFFEMSKDVEFVITTKENEIIYVNNIGDIAKIKKRILQDNSNLIKKESKNMDIKVYILKNQSTNHAGLSVFSFVFVVFILSMFCSIGYVIVSSRYIVRPIRQLKSIMEKTNHCEDIEEFPTKISNDEIEALFQSYVAVVRRLQNSIEKEKRISYLQLQSQFDLLQAQIDPHFLFNVLNIIASRGAVADDETICEICGKLAAMLRYSTNTNVKYATLKEEENYLQQYFSILKYRYEDTLQYMIEIDSNIYDEKIPKVVLQQIVENAVKHACKENVQISVYGGRIGAEGWYILVRDNGNGIEKEILMKIEEEIKGVKRKLSENRENVEMEIGGMGLINTFARMYLVYDSRLSFKIKRNDMGGTDVIIKVS